MKFKILILSHKFFPDIGGIESNSEVLAYAFTELGHEVKVITWSQGGKEKYFPFAIIRNPTLKILLSCHKWASVVFENNPSLKLSWPSLLINRPLVIALNTWVTRIDGNIAFLDKIKLSWLRRAQGVIAVSNAVREKCFKGATVINNPYRSSSFKTINSIVRNLDFVFLGRLVSDKGANLAIEAVNTLQKRY
jgi:glycosyltransferase involved in cell wall biosynthesis